MGEYDIVSESDLKRGICEFLERQGDRILFTVTPPKRTKYSSKFMMAGWPDVYGIFKEPLAPGVPSSARPFFIEVKKPGGTLSLEQHKILEQAKAMGAITCVAVSVQCVKDALGL